MANVMINSIQDLLAFASGQYGYGSSSDYLNVELGADLDFAEYDDTYNFGGCYGDWYLNFDGKGHKIDNIQYTGSSPWGFIHNGSGHVNEIKNLYLTNMYVVSGDNVGGVYMCAQAGSYQTNIRNCHVSGQIESYGSSTDAAGICYDRYKAVSISYCSFSGVLKNIGGTLFSILSNCSNRTTRTVSQCMGNCDMITASGYPIGISGWPSTAINSEYRGNMKVSSGASNLFPFVHGARGGAINCICIIKSDSTGGFHNDATGQSVYNNCYIDSDELSAAGISIGPFTGATTSQLKDVTWLKSKGFAL